MKNVTALIKDMWQTFSDGARNRDKTIIGFVVVFVFSLTLIILGLIRL
jgi:hypothetical protein